MSCSNHVFWFPNLRIFTLSYTNKQTDKQTNKQASKQASKQTNKHTHTHYSFLFKCIINWPTLLSFFPHISSYHSQRPSPGSLSFYESGITCAGPQLSVLLCCVACHSLCKTRHKCTWHNKNYRQSNRSVVIGILLKSTAWYNGV